MAGDDEGRLPTGDDEIILPPEPGSMQDLTCGLGEHPEDIPNAAPYDTSTEDEPAEVNDYDAWPEDDD